MTLKEVHERCRDCAFKCTKGYEPYFCKDANKPCSEVKKCPYFNKEEEK